MGLQHHGLQVAAGVGLGQVHRAGLAARYPGQILGLELLGRELVQRLGTVLQAPDVLEAGVGARDHLIRHHEIDEREVQPLVLARQRQPEQAGLTQRLDIAGRARSILHVIVHDLGAVVIDSLGVRGDHVAAHFADDFHHAAVAVLSVLEIDRRVVVRILVGISFLLELHDLLHQRMIHVELEILVVQKEISHSVYRILYRLQNAAATSNSAYNT